MTLDERSAACQPMVVPFPSPGIRVRLAYREIYAATNGTAEEIRALGPLVDLPRPWDPETCRDPDLRHEVWVWLDAVVSWLNHEYVWDVASLVPSCWPHHPHLVREVAVLADQRRRAGFAFSSDPLEEWHRYALPSFIDRMRGRMRDHCGDGHRTWPARGRNMRHHSPDDASRREDVYAADLAASNQRPELRRGRSEGFIFNIDTGEVLADPGDP